MSENLGLGVMINMLCGDEESAPAIKQSVGKKISSLLLEDQRLKIGFDNGDVLELFDNGQSCCENRYMRTDDALEDFVGAKFKSAEIKAGPNIQNPDGYGEEHETEFLDIKTSRGVFTITNHNEHNGYYGGFYVVARYYEGKKTKGKKQ